MIMNEVFSIGLMSGTSLDGLDLVYVKFDKNDYQNFTIIHAETIAYNLQWKQLLQNAVLMSKSELFDVDLAYGRFLGKAIQDFKHNYRIDKVDFIASHGHTILHQPEKGITLQIGNGKEIAKITGTKVVCDFRTQDVDLGGQGAPLVPIGDALLFADFDYCLNLGGFSNISFKSANTRIAFDICPVNIVLNFYANKLALDFDKSGQIASKGILNKELLKQLNSIAYYQREPPKSLGLEWVQKNIFPLIEEYESDISSILRTFSEHIAFQIAKVIPQHNSVLITGGGAFNTFLIDRIQHHTSMKFRLPSHELINFKEALVFAFLGLLRLENQINCLKSVTGAQKNHSSGLIFEPPF